MEEFQNREKKKEKDSMLETFSTKNTEHSLMQKRKRNFFYGGKKVYVIREKCG